MRQHLSLWQWKKILLLQGIVGILILSFYLYPFHLFWNWIDAFVFKSLNQTLAEKESWRLFWACANHRYADWVEDLFIFGFYFVAIKKVAKDEKRQKIFQFLFSMIFIALTVILINRFLFHDCFHSRRNSPTLTFDSAIRLSEQISWMDIKDDSTKSFPGDHATTAILFAMTFGFFTRSRLPKIFAFAYAFFLCFPRLITGAHWFSDLFVGSLSISLFAFAWVFYTPLYQKSINSLEKLFSLFKIQKVNN